MSAERWRLCPLNPLYLVSDQGRVRRVGGRILKPCVVRPKGYLKVSLGRKQQQYIHTLVLSTFVRCRPFDHQADHLNWSRQDNRLENLRWLPALENAVRWAGQTPDGRNIWTDNEEPEEGHVPMTREEQESLGAELAEWVA